MGRSYAFEEEPGSEKLVMGTRFGRRMLQLMARFTPEKLVSATIAAQGALTEEQLAERVEQIMADDDKERFTLDLALAANHSGPRRAGYQNDARQFPAIESLQLERITAPCLIVHGTADSDVAPDYGSFAAARIPGADLVELAGGTHLALFVHPDAPQVQERAMRLFRDAAES